MKCVQRVVLSRKLVKTLFGALFSNLIALVFIPLDFIFDLDLHKLKVDHIDPKLKGL